MQVRELRNALEAAKGKRALLTSQLHGKQADRESLKSYYENLVKARWVLTEVAKLTQEKFKDKVEKLVTMAIRSVFDRPFTFVLNFERKRNKLEVQPVVMENGNEYVPKDDLGGGILDTIGFALRVVLWSLEKPRSRNLLVLDEPGKWSGALITKFGAMIGEVSKGLSFQVLLITHDDRLLEIADRSWEFRNNGKGSVVTPLFKEKRKLKR